MTKDIEREIQEAFHEEAHERGFCLDQEWSDCENPYLNGDTHLAFDLFKSGWQAAIVRMEVRINTLDEMLLNQGEALAQAKAHEAKKLEGCVVVPVESLNKTIDAIEDMFEDDPTLALGELLPIQQDIKAMLEAARGGNEH